MKSPTPNFFDTNSPQRFLSIQYAFILGYVLLMAVLLSCLVMIVRLYKDKTDIFSLSSKERTKVLILNGIVFGLLLCTIFGGDIPPLDILDFYFIRSTTTRNNIVPTLPDRYRLYLQKMKATPQLYQYDGQAHDKKKKSMVAFYYVFTFPLFLIMMIQMVFTILYGIDIKLNKFVRPILIFQIIGLAYTIVLLLWKILSALNMVIYNPYVAVRIIHGKDFQKNIDMQHFIKKY